MARSCRTRRPAKRHVAKKSPEVYGNCYNQIKIYKKKNINYKILAYNMFWNQFMMPYRRNKYFCPISVYIFHQTTMWAFFDETISVYFIARQKEPSPSFHTLYFSVVETEVAIKTRHQNELIFILFGVCCDIIVKGGQASGATEVQVTLFYVKPNPTIFLYSVCQFV